MLTEIHQVCGLHYGGNTVNTEFFKFLTTLFSGPVIKEFRDNYPCLYFDLIETFDNIKSNFVVDKPCIVTIRIPIELEAIFETFTGETLEEALIDSSYNGKVIIKQNKLRIRRDLFRKFFDHSINYVLGVFEELFRKPEIKYITTLMAVGVGCESSVVINAMIQRFPNLTVIVPKEPDLVVLKGAVLYGLDTQKITIMVCICILLIR